MGTAAQGGQEEVGWTGSRCQSNGLQPDKRQLRDSGFEASSRAVTPMFQVLGPPPIPTTFSSPSEKHRPLHNYPGHVLPLNTKIHPWSLQHTRNRRSSPTDCPSQSHLSFFSYLTPSRPVTGERQAGNTRITKQPREQNVSLSSV